MDGVFLCFPKTSIESLVEIIGLGSQLLLVDGVLFALWADEDGNKLGSQVAVGS